ncbi:hypothetical protein [Clavibacter sp. CFBP 8614]|uniref:hypothetical protein n=1 Tax=unclassified Clavibacter TaxID=2626594 RepID=UPI004042997A
MTGGSGSTAQAASGRWEIAIVPTRRGRIGYAGRWALNMAMGVLLGSGDGTPPTHDLLLTERGSGRELRRIEAGSLHEARVLHETVREDLATLTVEEFAEEWGMSAESTA